MRHFAQYISMSPHGIGCKQTWCKKIYLMNRATWLNPLIVFTVAPRVKSSAYISMKIPHNGTSLMKTKKSREPIDTMCVTGRRSVTFQIDTLLYMLYAYVWHTQNYLLKIALWEGNLEATSIFLYCTGHVIPENDKGTHFNNLYTDANICSWSRQGDNSYHLVELS